MPVSSKSSYLVLFIHNIESPAVVSPEGGIYYSTTPSIILFSNPGFCLGSERILEYIAIRLPVRTSECPNFLHDCGGGEEFPCFLLLFILLHLLTESGIDVRSQMCSIRLGRRVYRYRVYLREGEYDTRLRCSGLCCWWWWWWCFVSKYSVSFCTTHLHYS